MKKRVANVHWEGTLKDGKGELSTESHVLDHTPYSYKTRFEDGDSGTNPEELLSAAHAGCFTMAVSSILEQAGFVPSQLDTQAHITMEGMEIKTSHLIIRGNIPGISQEKFREVVKDAEQNCIISKVLRIPITSEAILL